MNASSNFKMVIVNQINSNYLQTYTSNLGILEERPLPTSQTVRDPAVYQASLQRLKFQRRGRKLGCWLNWMHGSAASVRRQVKTFRGPGGMLNAKFTGTQSAFLNSRRDLRSSTL